MRPGSGSLAVARRTGACLALAAAAAAAAAPAGAEEVAVLPSVRDATLVESATGALANGSGPAIFAGRTSQAVEPRRRALLAFDVSRALPAGARIIAAELVLELTPSNPQPAEIAVHRVLADWGEGASSASGGGARPRGRGMRRGSTRSPPTGRGSHRAATSRRSPARGPRSEARVPTASRRRASRRTHRRGSTARPASTAGS